MKRKLMLMLLTAFYVLVVVACVTTPDLTSGPTSKAGAGVIAERPVFVLGSRFEFRSIDFVSNKTSTFTLLIEKKEVYRNKPAYWFRIIRPREEARELYDVYDENFNLLATVDRGEEIRSYEPRLTRYSWPLAVGKKWFSRYDLREGWGESWQTWDLTNKISVEAYEEIEVPAGKFQAFKIKRLGPAITEIYWYAPEIGMIVKRELERYSTHRLGYGKWLEELVAFRIPNTFLGK